MSISHNAILFFAALATAAGCTPTVSNDRKVNGGESEKTSEPDEKKPEADEKKPEASVDVAVGSVLLENDCPDPPATDSAVPASIAPPAAPAKEAMPVSPGVTAPSAQQRPGVGVARRACQQSTLQLTFENAGTVPAKVSVVEVRLRDVKTDRQVATLPSRMPSVWSETDNAYAQWDENLAASSSARTSYRIKPPSWSDVEAKLDGEASRGRTYSVEVSLEVNGVAVTARSAEFTRPPVVPMPPT